MNNPLVEKIENEFKQLGFQDAELIRESYSVESFGNAQAIYRIGNLYLNFIRDRGDDTVDFLNPTDLSDTFIFDDMSLLMGWKTLDEMVERRNNIDFSKPPSGPIPSLDEALRRIKQHYEELQHMFSLVELGGTLIRLRETYRKRCKAIFGSEPT